MRSRPPVGGRAVAIRNADHDAVYLYGHGTYVGRRPRPAGEFDPDEVLYDDGTTMRRMVTDKARHQVAQERTEFVYHGTPTGLDQYGYRLDEDWPVERRVAADLEYLSTNECIEITDEHGTVTGHVYGHQCWWTSAESYAASFRQGRAEVLVPVPDGQAGPAPAPSTPDTE